MTKQQTLADRAKLVGIKWDADERQWTGTLESDGEPMRFWLTSKQLVDYLDAPRETAEQGVAA